MKHTTRFHCAHCGKVWESTIVAITLSRAFDGNTVKDCHEYQGHPILCEPCDIKDRKVTGRLMPIYDNT